MRAGGMVIVAAMASLALWPAAALGQSVLREDFEAGDFSAESHLFYKKNAEQAAGAMRFQSEVVRSGRGALELSVRATCPAQDPDCSERAEVWEKPGDHVPYMAGAWYAFSVKFGDPIPQDDHRYVIAQWKRDIEPGARTDFSPLLALRLNRGKLFATVETGLMPYAAASGDPKHPCADGDAPVWVSAKRGQTRALIAAQADFDAADLALFKSCASALKMLHPPRPLPAPASGWIDFVIYSRPGPQGGGAVEIIANGEPIVSVRGQIGHDGAGLGESQYFKFGPYRAGGQGIWTMYYDNFRRGPRCVDVADAKICPDPAG